MSEVIIVAIISLAGTCLGSITGIMTANKLTNYRIEKIEENLKEIKDLTNRVYNLETHNKLQDSTLQQLSKDTSRLIDDMKYLKRGAKNADS